MVKNAALVRSLCLPYCRYYKKGTNEELTCRGAMVVERLMLSGRPLNGISPGRSHQPLAADEELRTRLCDRCDFREHDCDFAEDRMSQPCGGFLLLSCLIQTRAIMIEDIESAGGTATRKE